MSYLDNIYNSSNYEYLNPSQNSYGNLELDVYPAAQVVTTAELKSQLRIDTSDEDALLTSYILAATQMAEHYCNRHFIEAKYKLWFKELPSKFSLYYPDCKFNFTPSTPPVAGEVDGLFYFNKTTQTYVEWAYGQWYVDTSENPVVINMKQTPSTAQSFDENQGDNFAPYYFQFKTGMGTAASDVPDAIKQAIKLIAADMYYFREDRKRSFPMASEILLQPYKCYL